MQTPQDPDQLLALALVPPRRRQLRPARTHAEILAAARRARARAAGARRQLQETRERCGATIAETLRTCERLRPPGGRDGASRPGRP